METMSRKSQDSKKVRKRVNATAKKQKKQKQKISDEPTLDKMVKKQLNVSFVDCFLLQPGCLAHEQDRIVWGGDQGTPYKLSEGVSLRRNDQRFVCGAVRGYNLPPVRIQRFIILIVVSSWWSGKFYWWLYFSSVWWWWQWYHGLPGVYSGS